MDLPATLPRRPRGRPPRHGHGHADTRALLLRRGVELLTERGVAATALDEVLQSAGVPKGSFYHYFPNKEAFVLAALEAYGAYFLRKLDRHLDDTGQAPLARLRAFVDDACRGVERHDFARGCMAGNLGQEIGCHGDMLRQALEGVFAAWEGRVAACLEQARAAGELAPEADCALLAQAFWIGWEGAILRARMLRSTAPMRIFFDLFLAALRPPC